MRSAALHEPHSSTANSKPPGWQWQRQSTGAPFRAMPVASLRRRLSFERQACQAGDNANTGEGRSATCGVVLHNHL